MIRLPPAQVFLARQIRELMTKLGATLPRVRKQTDDEAIHDMRVALRRLRVVLKIARPIFGRYHVDTIRAAFTRLHRASGALRDEEVLRETLAGLGVASAELDAWMQRRVQREAALRTLIEKRLRAGDLRRPMRLLRALLALPVAPKRRRALAPYARKVVLRARKDVESQRDASPDDSIAMHDLRIAYKRLRYSTEIFAPALPLDLAALAKPAERFQKTLGEIHDLDVARAVVARARNLADAQVRLQHAITEARKAKVELYLREQPITPRRRPRR